jgi:hypothetical protein
MFEVFHPITESDVIKIVLYIINDAIFTAKSRQLLYSKLYFLVKYLHSIESSFQRPLR